MISESKNARQTLNAVFNFFGGLSGLLSIGLIIWKGGVLWQIAMDTKERVVTIEQGGSIGLREHVKLDDERVREIQLQQQQDREARARLVEQVTAVASDVRVINAKLDVIKEQMNGRK